MVVDLTDTWRYYDGQKEFEERDIRWRKIRCPGWKGISFQVFDGDEKCLEAPACRRIS